MNFLRILTFAAFAACGAIIGGAESARAAPMPGLPAALSLENSEAPALLVQKAYYHGRHYRHRYYRHRYYRHRYYHPYRHRRYYHPRYYHRRYYY